MPTPSNIAKRTASRSILDRQNLSNKSGIDIGARIEDSAGKEVHKTVTGICINTAANYIYTAEDDSFGKTDNFALPNDYDLSSGDFFKVFYISQQQSPEVFAKILPDDLLCAPETDERYQKLIYNIRLGAGGGKAIVDRTKFNSLPNRGDILTIAILESDKAAGAEVIKIDSLKTPKCGNIPVGEAAGTAGTTGSPDSTQPSDLAAQGSTINYSSTPGSTYVDKKGYTKNAAKPNAETSNTKFVGGLIIKSSQGNKRTKPLTSMVLHYSLCNSLGSMLSAFEVSPDKGGVAVGTHFSIDKEGKIFQHMEVDRITNNCGTGGWNSKAVGIDLNFGFGGRGAAEVGWVVAPAACYKSLYDLMEDLCKKYGIRRKVLWPNSDSYNRNGWMMAWKAEDPDKPFADAKKFDGIVAHSHVQKNRRDAHCGTYYLKLRYEGKNHETAYQMLLAATKENQYKIGGGPIAKKQEDHDKNKKT